MLAIEHLPRGATLIFEKVSWDDYEALTDDLMIAGRHMRVSYDHGKVEIMSPLNEHERFASLFDLLVSAYADHFSLPLENLRGSTWRRRKLHQGLEAGSCYYVKNADRIIGIKQIDLEQYPPPDIALEIDITNNSLSKFDIYAALKVPEIWRYDGKKVQFYELQGDAYHVIAESRFLPGLKPEMLAAALEQSKTEGQTVARRAFRQRLNG